MAFDIPTWQTREIDLVIINGDHERDRHQFIAASSISFSFDYAYILDSAGTYIYDSSTATFELAVAPVTGTHSRVAISSYYVEDFDDEIEVNATLRTIEILNENMAMMGASAYLFAKMQPGVQILQTGDESNSELYMYDMNSNVEPSAAVTFKNYFDDNDINGENVQIARVNGVRSFIAPTLVSRSNMSKAISVQLKFKNETRLFDLILAQQPRREVGNAPQ